MKMKLFEQIDLGVEEKIVEKIVAVEPLTAEDVIVTQEALDALKDVEQTIVVANEAIATADFLVGNLNKQVDAEKALAETPEKVTADSAVLSMETLQVTAALLGAEIEPAVSAEAIEADPVESLRLATEAKASFMQKSIENIKLLFKKFVTWLKKLYTKAVVAMTGISKQAENLAKSMEDAKDAKSDIKVDEAMAKLIKGKVGALVIELGKGKLDANLGSAVADSASDTKLVSAIGGLVDELVKTIEAELKALEGDKKVKGSDILGKISGITQTAQLFEGGASGEEGAVSKTVKFSGMSAKKISFKLPKVDAEKEYTAAEAAGLIRQVSFGTTTKTYEDKDLKVDSVKYADVVKSVKALVAPAKDIKKYMDEVEKTVAAVEKTVEGLSKEENEAYVPVVKFANVIISNIAMDLVLGAVGNIKSTLSVANACFKAATAGEEKKEDKKEEKK